MSGKKFRMRKRLEGKVLGVKELADPEAETETERGDPRTESRGHAARVGSQIVQ